MEVLIIGREDDPSTNDLLAALLYRGHRATRINGTVGHSPISVELMPGQEARCYFDGRAHEKIDAILFRKEHNPYVIKIEKNLDPEMSAFLDQVTDFQQHELRQTRHAVYSIAGIPSYPDMAAVGALNKIMVLREASRVGLRIPRTILTNSKKELLRFAKDAGKVITKPINEFYSFRFQGRSYAPYTAQLQSTEIDGLPDLFFPALVQEEIVKLYEVRSFYAKHKSYSMAQFSANHASTVLDYRYYDDERPTRRVPYRLPLETERLIDILMTNLGLSTGSIDLIRSGREYYFLEVNPVGQYGMVAQACNYNLDQALVEMIENDRR